MTPATITKPAKILAGPIVSRKNTQPSNIAKRMEISRKAVTRAMGASVMAQTTSA